VAWQLVRDLREAGYTTALAATVAAPVANVAALRVLQATYLCEG